MSNSTRNQLSCLVGKLFLLIVKYLSFQLPKLSWQIRRILGRFDLDSRRSRSQLLFPQHKTPAGQLLPTTLLWKFMHTLFFNVLLSGAEKWDCLPHIKGSIDLQRILTHFERRHRHMQRGLLPFVMRQKRKWVCPGKWGINVYLCCEGTHQCETTWLLRLSLHHAESCVWWVPSRVRTECQESLYCWVCGMTAEQLHSPTAGLRQKQASHVYPPGRKKTTHTYTHTHTTHTTHTQPATCHPWHCACLRSDGIVCIYMCTVCQQVIE